MSEAQVAVPEPLAVGEVLSIEVGEHVGMLAVELSPDLEIGQEVGIWHASLAEQVADRELDNEGLTAVLVQVRSALDEIKGCAECARWAVKGAPFCTPHAIQLGVAFSGADRLSETREGEANDA